MAKFVRDTPTKADILKAAAIERMIAADALVSDTFVCDGVRHNALHRANSLEAIAKGMKDD